jgi:drug/metabolite transporter (DMT)-like permease
MPVLDAPGPRARSAAPAGSQKKLDVGSSSRLSPASTAPENPWQPLGGHPLLLSSIGAALLGMTGLLFRESHTSPATATTFRCLYALPLLWLLCRYERRRGAQPWRGSRVVAWLAGAMLAADLVLWLRSVDDIGAGLATVLGNVQLVFVILASAAFLGERLSAPLLAGVGSMTVGVGLIGGLLQRHPYGVNPGQGALLAVAAGVLYGGYIMLMRRASGGVASVFPLAHATAAAALTAAVLGWCFAELNLQPAWSAQGWLLLLAVSGQVLAWLLLTVPTSRLPASATSLVLTLQPIFGLLAGVLVLAERPNLVQLVGVSVLVAGFVVALRARNQPRWRAPSTGKELR